MDDILDLLYSVLHYFNIIIILIVYHKVYLFFGRISVASAPPTMYKAASLLPVVQYRKTKTVLHFRI